MALKLDKKVLIHTSAGLVASLLLVFAVSQCNGKGAAEAERDEVAENAKIVSDKAAAIVKDAQAKVDSLAQVNRGLGETVAQQADSIVVLNDSIVVLNDSINVLNGKLAKCPANKKPAVPAKKVNPVKKPVAKTPAVSVKPVAQVKPQQGTVNVTVPADTVRGATVVVADGAAPVNVNNVTVSGANNGQIIINNGGIVNSNQNTDAASQKVVRDTMHLVIFRAHTR